MRTGIFSRLCVLAWLSAGALAAAIAPNSDIIVVFKDGAEEDAVASHTAMIQQRHRAHVNSLTKRGVLPESIPDGLQRTYNFGNFNGYAGQFDPATIAAIGKSGVVKYVSPDKAMKISTIVTQNKASWALDRISHVDGSSPSSYSYPYNDAGVASAITAYIVDTGIQGNHTDFEGRVTWAPNFSSDHVNEDRHGHGTFCAGLVGSKTYGVAKKVHLVAVKTHDQHGNSFSSNVISGIQWAVKDAKAGGKKGVMNISSGQDYEQVLNDAVKAAVDSGLIVVVAAGNDDQDVKYVSPASEPSAITVAAIDQTDSRASFSNYGANVDIFAPGKNIPSLWIGPNGYSMANDGTSASSPIVAGLAAYIWSFNTSWTGAYTTDVLLRTSLPDRVTNPGAGSINKMAFNWGGAQF